MSRHQCTGPVICLPDSESWCRKWDAENINANILKFLFSCNFTPFNPLYSISSPQMQWQHKITVSIAHSGTYLLGDPSFHLPISCETCGCMVRDQCLSTFKKKKVVSSDPSHQMNSKHKWPKSTSSAHYLNNRRVELSYQRSKAKGESSLSSYNKRNSTVFCY